jgi:hypothetical protein
LLPPVTDLRTVSAAVAIAVASAADEHGLAEQLLTDPVRQITKRCGAPTNHVSESEIRLTNPLKPVDLVVATVGFDRLISRSRQGVGASASRSARFTLL